MEWFRKIDLTEYINIVKYEKINGRDLIDGEKDFYIKMMGMLDMDHYQKVKYELSLVRNAKYINNILYGWGSNQNLQFNIDSSSTFIRKPTKLSLPEEAFLENDYPKNIYCGKSTSMILTFYGKLFIMGNSALIKEQKEQKETKEKDSKESKSSAKGSDKRRKSSMNSNKKESNNQGNSSISGKLKSEPNTIGKWANITTIVNSKFDGYFKIKDLNVNNENLMLLGFVSNYVPYYCQNKKPKYKHDETKKSNEKFLTCEEVLQRLQAVKSDLEQFFFVYENPKYGLLENSITAFLSSEVPFHKVLQIKHLREVIWDRKKRYIKN